MPKRSEPHYIAAPPIARTVLLEEARDVHSRKGEKHSSKIQIPKLDIVIMVIGSRGDIQPFSKIGKILKKHGHRVRIATHPTFKTFVEEKISLELLVGGALLGYSEKAGVRALVSKG